MSASITDTAGLVTSPVTPIQTRAAVRRARRRLRRQHRVYALSGVLALLAVFGATLAVLDAVR